MGPSCRLKPAAEGIATMLLGRAALWLTGQWVVPRAKLQVVTQVLILWRVAPVKASIYRETTQLVNHVDAS